MVDVAADFNLAIDEEMNQLAKKREEYENFLEVQSEAYIEDLRYQNDDNDKEDENELMEDMFRELADGKRE